MTQVLALLGFSLLAGMVARRLKAFPENTPAALGAVILNVALPALVIRVIHGVALSPQLAIAASMLWAQFLLALALFSLARRWLGFSRETLGALVLTAGLSNTAFVGLPVIEMVLGPDALGPAVVIDQLGSFLVMATLGITVAATLSGGRAQRRPSARELLRRVVLFPPFLALLLGLLLRPVPLPAWVLEPLERIGALLTPLALFSVGFQLRLTGLSSRAGVLAAGLGFKLLLAPLAIAALMSTVAAPTAMEWKVAVLQAAMPPMVTGAILATEHRLDPPLANAMLGVGIPLSALTLALAALLVR